MEIRKNQPKNLAENAASEFLDGFAMIGLKKSQTFK
jgi:hypothetical protein